MQPSAADGRAVRRVVQCHESFVIPVAEGPRIAQRHDEGEPGADIAGRPGDRLRIAGQPVHQDRGIDVDHGSYAGQRQTAKGQYGVQIEIDRGMRIERHAPELEPLVVRPEGKVAQSPGVAMGIHERRKADQPAIRAGASRWDDVRDQPVLPRDCGIAQGWRRPGSASSLPSVIPFIVRSLMRNKPAGSPACPRRPSSDRPRPYAPWPGRCSGPPARAPCPGSARR